MSDPMMTVTFECRPGQATAAFAAKCQQATLDLVNAIAADQAREGEPPMVFTPRELRWVDDGKDEIVIRVYAGVAAHG